jgi:hypothetical protein
LHPLLAEKSLKIRSPCERFWEGKRGKSFLSLMLLHLDPVCIPAGLDGSGINDEWKWTDEGDVSNKLE